MTSHNAKETIMTVRELIAQLIGRNVESLPLPLGWDKKRLNMPVRVAVSDHAGCFAVPHITNVIKSTKHIGIYVKVDREA